MNPQLLEAFQSSYLAALAPEHVERILKHANMALVPAEIVVPGAVEPPKIGLVVSGLIRVYLSAPSGRQLTIGYARRGDVLGTSQIFRSGSDKRSADVSGQVLIASTIAAIDVGILREIALSDAEASCVFAAQISGELDDATAELQFNSFAALRQRVARHLLGLATPIPGKPDVLEARVSQDALANAVASTREAVARIIRDFREEQTIRSLTGSIEIVDPIALSAAARLRPNQ